MSSNLLLCSTCAHAEALMRRSRHSVTRDHLYFGSGKWHPLPSRKDKTILIVVSFSFLGISARSSLLDCCVLFPLRARPGTEAPLPQHRAPSSFFGSGEMAPSPQRKKIHFDCCFFLLVFPWLRRGAEKGTARHHVV